MNARERAALTAGYAAIVITVLGALAIFATAAAAGAVCLFVAGLLGVVGATAVLVQAEATAGSRVGNPG